MQDCRDLLSRLNDRGIRLWVESGQLRFQGPPGALVPELRDELRRLRNDVIHLLEQGEDDAEEVPLQPRAAGAAVPLTAMQLRRWKNRHREKRYRLRTSTIATRAVGEIKVSCLRASLDALIERHESLRTRFVEVDGTPWQNIDTPHPAEFEVIDLTGFPENERQPRLRFLVNGLLAEEVDLCEGPLFTAKLFKLSNQEHVLVVTLNHMITDGASDEIIRSELWSLYRQLSEGKAPSLPSLALQFADYAVWQQRTGDAWTRRHAAYWVERLCGAPIVKFPVDGNLPKTSNGRAMRRITFGARLSSELRKFAQRQHYLLSLVILTLYALKVSQWCKQKDFVARLILSSRYRPELSNMVGFLANHLYLRIQLSEGGGFLDSLNRVQQEFHTAFDHLDFDRAPEFVPECHDTDFCFNWAPEFRWTFERPEEMVGKLTLESFECLPTRVLNFMPFLYDDGQEVAGWIEYRCDRFSADTVRHFELDLHRLAEGCLHEPNAPITSILATGSHISAW